MLLSRHTRRRAFIAGLGGAVAWPLAALAQQPRAAAIGYLTSGSSEGGENYLAGLRKGLSESGYVEGTNLTIEYRWASSDLRRLPELANDLVRREVAVIVAAEQTSVLAAKAATKSIPVVFFTGGDAVESGLVSSLSRPGGNVTGLNSMSVELEPKRLGLLHELLPKASRFGLLVNPNVPNLEGPISRIKAAAGAIGCSVEIVSSRTNPEIDAAFASLAQNGIEALVVSPATLFENRRVQISTLAVRYIIPMISFSRSFTEVGGLMSYAANLIETYQQVGLYVGRILRGESPSELPVMQPAKFEFVINLQTARTLSIEVPPTLLTRADEVIE
jgi:putative tryptophan/tyrosine transport system substrate-binding protein